MTKKFKISDVVCNIDDLDPGDDRLENYPLDEQEFEKYLIRKLSFQIPIVVNPDGKILAFCLTWFIAKELGLKTVSIFVAEHLPTPDQSPRQREDKFNGRL